MKQSQFNMILVLCLFMVFPQYAFALGVFESSLGKILQILTGPEARIMATIAVIIFGVLCLRGRVPWSWGGTLIIGIVIIFGAAPIVAYFKP